ncbi:MAG: pseudouridine synthase [Planctomycetota bacterium]
MSDDPGIQGPDPGAEANAADSGARPPALRAPEEFDPSWILFHGSGLLAVDKPAGLPMHRGTAHERGLAELIDGWVRMHPGTLDVRPGRPIRPVHRLDLEATGVALFALTRRTAAAVEEAFAAGQVKKKYLAVVAGPVEALGCIRGAVRARFGGEYRRVPAELTFRRLEGDERLSLVEVVPGGGRTHQIRQLFARAGRPLAGDFRYGKPTPSRQFLYRFQVPSFLLHAVEVTLPPEVLGAAKTIRAEIPETFRRLIREKWGK